MNNTPPPTFATASAAPATPAAPAPDPTQEARFPSLAGRVAFVTGGATGIGEAIVSALARQGCRVAFVDLAGDAAAALAERLHAQGLPRPWWQQLDVRDVAALQRAVADAAAALGDIHVLVNNVAHDERHALDAVTPSYWDDRMAVNQRPAFFAIQAVVPGMRRLGGGAIINLGSTGWQAKTGDYPGYAVAKASVNGLTRGLAKPLGRDRIRINTVTPGWVMTERQLRLWVQPDTDFNSFQCLPDPIQPHEVTGMVLFLAADDGRACTAQEFIVDAGWI